MYIDKKNGQFDKFLSKLELIIRKLLMKDKILILCGDWATCMS